MKKKISSIGGVFVKIQWENAGHTGTALNTEQVLVTVLFLWYCTTVFSLQLGQRVCGWQVPGSSHLSYQPGGWGTRSAHGTQPHPFVFSLLWFVFCCFSLKSISGTRAACKSIPFISQLCELFHWRHTGITGFEHTWQFRSFALKKLRRSNWC